MVIRSQDFKVKSKKLKVKSLEIGNWKLEIVWKLEIGNWKLIKKAKTKRIAVINSTAGYCQEMLFPHFRHFPRKNRKLKTGILSYQES